MDRLEFAKRLNSLAIPEDAPNVEVQVKMRPVSEALTHMMPTQLFRYRLCNDLQIEAFRNDIIYCVTADNFNDPYDTLITYDLEGIRKGLEAMMSYDAFNQSLDWLKKGGDFPDILKRFMPDVFNDNVKSLMSQVQNTKDARDEIDRRKTNLLAMIETYFPVLSEITKKFSTIACFSEKISSVLMWSHYTDSHKGFALEYNFRPVYKTFKSNVGLYPVIYGERRKDYSMYLTWAFFKFLGFNVINPDITMAIKTALNKSKLWEYEQEWRMIDFSVRDFRDSTPSEIIQKPVAIYYGGHISKERKRELHLIAKEKRIPEYEMYVDYSSPLYEMKYRPSV